MENQQNSAGVKKTPTEISKLALEFLTLCESDSVLMNRVYSTSLALLGINNNTFVSQKKEEVVSKVPTNTALTPDEARQAKEEFRQKLGLSKLTVEQTKIAKAIFRDRKGKASASPGHVVSVPVAAPSAPSKKKEKQERPDPNARLNNDPKVALGEGTRKTWNIKLQQQRQRALERSVTLSDSPKDVFKQADYYNARITLADTWSRFNQTYDCSNKKDPLLELPPLPDADAIKMGMKSQGVQIRQHETGQFILQDEVSGKSLRPKD